jgi:hypothetical protein
MGALREKIFAWPGCSLLLIFFLFGCSGYTMKHYNRPGTDMAGIRRIAVLPLNSFTGDPKAGDKVRMMLITDLLSRNIDVIEPGQVTKVIREANVRNLRFISNDELVRISKDLGADALIAGSVDAYVINKGVGVSYPEVTISLVMTEANTGSIIWSVWHSSGGPGFFSRHFGAEGLTLSEAASRVVKEIVDTSLTKVQRKQQISGVKNN